jgi:hypothetical protein
MRQTQSIGPMEEMVVIEASWVTLEELYALYPAFQLADELILQGERCHVGHHI